MPDVQPVKNAQRQNRRPCNIRVLCAVKYFHPLQNGIAVAGIQQARVPDDVSIFHILCEVEQNKQKHRKYGLLSVFSCSTLFHFEGLCLKSVVKTHVTGNRDLKR